MVVFNIMLQYYYYNIIQSKANFPSGSANSGEQAVCELTLDENVHDK